MNTLRYVRVICQTPHNKKTPEKTDKSKKYQQLGHVSKNMQLARPRFQSEIEIIYEHLNYNSCPLAKRTYPKSEELKAFK
ncbi:25867_t:CDS:1, partial [Gigaspora margarita]